MGEIYVSWSRCFADVLVIVNRAAQGTHFLLPLGLLDSLLPGLFTSTILLLVLKVQRETAALKSPYIVFDLLWKPPLPLSGWADGPLALAFSRPLAASLLFLSLFWPGLKNVWSLGICIGGEKRRWWSRRSWTEVLAICLLNTVFMCLNGRTTVSMKAKKSKICKDWTLIKVFMLVCYSLLQKTAKSQFFFFNLHL